MNKVVKDALVKYQRMQGFHCPFVPGWDCHGLPIEHKVLTSKKEDLDKVLSGCYTDSDNSDPAVLRARCREYAQHWVDCQKAEFKSLGTDVFVLF